MEHQKPVSKTLFIEELEKPAQANLFDGKGGGECEVPAGKVTTLAIGEECFKI